MLVAVIQTSELLYMFFVLFFMLILTYFTTRFIAKNYGTTSGRRTKSFEIIDKIQLGKDTALIIVKVGEKVVLLGVTPQNVNKICCLEDNFLENFTKVDKILDEITFTDTLLKNIKSNFGKEENEDFDENEKSN